MAAASCSPATGPRTAGTAAGARARSRTTSMTRATAPPSRCPPRARARARAESAPRARPACGPAVPLMVKMPPALRAKAPAGPPSGSAHDHESTRDGTLNGLHAIEVDAVAQAFALVAAAVQRHAVQSGCHIGRVEQTAHATAREIVELDAHRSGTRGRERERRLPRADHRRDRDGEARGHARRRRGERAIVDL